ncbi:MAG: SLC13 family permease, partial [Alphaproteobacteria bacterium]|nr:SLC13 family permease [Alphaproteobacteria bacterium]
LLMPMSFAALLGGMVTLIGTSPNIIVARVRAELGGAPFGMFDFAPVGIGLTLAGLAFLCVFWRLLPRSHGAGADAEPAEQAYVTEARPAEGSPIIGKTVAAFEALTDDEVTLAAIVRRETQRLIPAGHWRIAADDVLVLEGDADALKRAVDVAKLALVGQKPPPEKEAKPADEKAPAEKPRGAVDTAIVEAVVTEASPLVNTSLARFRLRDRHGVSVLAIRRSGRRLTQRLRRVAFRVGDVVVLEGHEDAVPGVLAALRLLPLAERNVQLGRGRKRFLPLGILAVAMAAAASHAVPVQVAFFAAAVGVVLVGALSLKDAYDSIEWPILVLLAALIPVSDALRSTGATDLLAGAIAAGASALPAWGALALMIVAAMAVTPFLNNAATVLIMAPVGAGFAHNLGLNPDPFLMAVAVGAACDFLTPIGHQCNTLVMGPGGYAFGDYWRLGLPLSAIVVVLGTALIALFWPLGAG